MRHPFQRDEAEERERVSGPALKPKDAAVLVLVRREKGTIRVLMGERNRRHVFLPGRLVFPGGRVDAADRRLAVATDFRPEVGARVAAGIGPERARALGLAAIRETFEEAGVLVGERYPNPPRTRSDSWRRFFAHGVTPRLEALDFVARAVTPPGSPRRFDARFFMAGAEHIAQDLAAQGADGELLRTAWRTLAEAREADMVAITRCILDEIEARLGDGTDPDRPAPFYMLRRGKAEVRLL
jgi:8-oxo-dGTP pyrophosphatase MutT (NUDIX family)